MNELPIDSLFVPFPVSVACPGENTTDADGTTATAAAIGKKRTEEKQTDNAMDEEGEQGMRTTREKNEDDTRKGNRETERLETEARNERIL